MVPAVSLNYSSQNRDGFVGWGWTLSYGVASQGHTANQSVLDNGHTMLNATDQSVVSGVSGGSSLSVSTPNGSGNTAAGDSTDLRMITRCPRTLAQDNIHGSVNFDANDRFCMDGQRLILFSGTYGANGSEYRTELNTFQRITAHGTFAGGPSFFTVETKDGKTLDFGGNTTSQVVAGGLSKIRAWALDTVTDKMGNYLAVSYNDDSTNGQIYPSRIDYTINAGAGLATYNAVVFNYATRGDVTPYYQAGAIQQTNQILTEIKTLQSGSVVSDYTLTYRAGTALLHSELQSVKQCDASGTTCLPLTTFGWQGGTGTLSFSSLIPLSLGSGANAFLGDLNGDGIPDTYASTSAGSCFTEWQLYTGNPTGGFTLSNPSYACVAGPASATSLTGKQLSDVQTTVFLLNAFQLNTGSGLTPAAGFFAGLYWPGDFNGDGRTDFFSDGADNSSGTALLKLSNGDGTFSAGTPPPLTGLAYTIADFDGDGCADIMHGQNYVGPEPPIFPTTIYYSCQPAVATTVIPHSYGHIATVGDVNGDGKTDILVDGTLNLSTGVGFTPTTFNVGLIGGNISFSGDFDGNGLTDAVNVTLSGSIPTVHVYLSTGTGYDVSGGSFSLPAGYGVLKVADLNGDGASDFLVTNGGGALPTGEVLTTYTPEAIKTIDNGIGVKTTVKYDRLNAGTVYTKGSGAAYPTIDVQNGMYVVSEVDASNGLGTCAPPTMTFCYVTTYAYAGARSDLQGRGFLGFTSLTKTDPQTHLAVTTTYHTDFPYVGLVASNAVTTTAGSSCGSAGIVVSSATNTYTPATPTLPATPLFVALQNSDVQQTDCGTTLPEAITAYTYDANGNATQISQTIKMSGVVSSTSVTNNTYATPDFINWLFLLSDTSTTNTLSGVPITRSEHIDYLSGTDFVNHTVIEPGSTTLLVDTAYTLDPFGNPIVATTTGSGFLPRTTHASYDLQGRFVLTTTDALGFVDHYTNDPAFGGLLSHTDPNAVATSWSYDTFGRKTRETRADGTYTAISYIPCPTGCPGIFEVQAIPYSPSAVQDGPMTASYFDMLGRDVEDIANGFSPTGAPALITHTKAYDGNGRMVSESRPTQSSPVFFTYTYDDFGRVKTATAPDGGVTATSYAGLTTTVTDPLSHVTMATKNPQGLTASVKDALTNTTSYVYDAFGDLLSVTDPLSNVTSSTYDLRGRKLTSTDPDMGHWIYAYDGLGELTGQTDAKGQVTTPSYDLDGRMIQRIEADLTSTWTYGTTAPSINRLVSESASGSAGLSSGGFTRTIGYDSLSRPNASSAIFNAAAPIGYAVTYNSDGRLDTVSYPSGFVAKYVYAPTNGMLSQIKDNVSGSVLFTVSNRNADLSLTSATLGNGVAETDTYDPDTGRLTAVRAGPSDGVAKLDYIYDLLGNLTYRADDDESVFEKFCYDGLNRLTNSATGSGTTPAACTSTGTGITSKSIGYDALGNITFKNDVGTYSYLPSGSGSVRPHAMSGITGTVNGVVNPAYSYDGNGNLTSGAGRVVTPTSFNMALNIVQGTTHVVYAYGPEHEPVRRQNAVSPPPFQTTLYVDDPASGAKEEHDGTNGIWHDFLAVDGHVVAERNCTGASPCTAGATWQYFTGDHLGSTAILTNGSGTVTERDSYDAWGRRRNPDGTDNPSCAITSATIIGYTGHEQMDSVCQVNANARIYDPTIGRFMSPDNTISNPADLQDWNPYSYVSNRPLTMADPSGHDGCMGTSCSGGDFNDYQATNGQVGSLTGTAPSETTTTTTTSDNGSGEIQTSSTTTYGRLAQANTTNADLNSASTVTSCAGLQAAGCAVTDQTGRTFSGGSPAENLKAANLAVAPDNAALIATTGYEYGNVFGQNNDGSVTTSVSVSDNSPTDSSTAMNEIRSKTVNAVGDQHGHPGLPGGRVYISTLSVHDVDSGDIISSQQGRPFVRTIIDGPTGAIVSYSGRPDSMTQQADGSWIRRADSPTSAAAAIIGHIPSIPYHHPTQ